MNFNKGDRVVTPGGVGSVVYCRMAAPNYDTVSVYSVRLDHTSHNPNYTGTVYPAKDVAPEK